MPSGTGHASYNHLVVKFSTSFLVAALVLGCGSPPPYLDSPGRLIVCFGDSITYGVGAAESETYPARLAEILDREILNEGIPGETASEGLARIDEILELDPWLVIVELGGNDLLQGRPFEETEAALRGILEELLAARVLPVLVEIHGPLGGAFEDLFKRLAAEYHVPLLEDVLPRILRSPRLKSDRIHPNKQGYQLLAEEMAELLGPILKARKETRG